MKKALLILLTLTLFASACAAPADLSDEELDLLKMSMSEAKATLKDSEASESDIMFAHLDLALAYNKFDKTNKSLSEYKLVLEIEPDNYIALNNLTNHYETEGDLEQARYYVGFLHKFHKTRLEVIRDTVRILAKTGEFDEAENVMLEYSVLKQNEPEYAEFIADRLEYVYRMKAAAEAKQAE